MIHFKCAGCGKDYKFKALPIPDGGAKFKCDACGKTSLLIRKNNKVFCVLDEENIDGAYSSMMDMGSTATRDEMSPEELEARLQGIRPDMPFDSDIHIGVIKGPEKGQSFPVNKPIITIGKTGCDINLSDANISREHCQIEIYGNQMTIVRDLRSTGGTFKNGYPVTVALLWPGDIIQIGETQLVLIQNPKNISH